MAMDTKRVLAGTAVAALALSLAACGGSSDSSNGGGSSGKTNTSSSTGGTLTYFVNKPLEHTDPQRTYVGRDLTNFRRTVYRSLVAFPISEDPKVANTPVPDLATTTGKSSNGAKTWSFTLKDGIKWQDGSPITCDDFKYGASRVFATDVITGGPNYLLSNLDVPADKKTGLPSYLGPYAKNTPAAQAAFDKAISCKGNTITYNFNKPWPDFPLAVASLSMMDPYKKSQDKGDLSNFTIFSNGPYMLEGGTTWDKERGGTLVRNPNYDPATDSTDIRKALPDKITFDIGKTGENIYDLILQDSSEAQAAVTGERLPPSYLPKVHDKSRYANVDSPYSDYLVPNTKRLSLPVRQALAQATNRDAWIKAGGGPKFFVPSQSVVNTAVTGYQPNPAFKDIPLAGDPAAAKKILTDAGIKMPVPIKFTFQSTPTATKQAAALQQTWNQAGFKVTLDPLTDTYYDVIQKPDSDSDITWAGWGADWPSAMTVTPALFDSRPNLTKNSNGQDYGNYKSDAFNALVDKAANSASLTDQTKYLQDADVQLGKDVAYIPLEQSLFNWGWGSKVTNFTTTPASNGYPDLGAIGVEQ